MKPKCRTCGSTTHYTYQCFQTRKKQIKPKAKTISREKQTRLDWIELNPPDKYGFWDCYLKISPQCLIRIDIDQLTLDHVIPKGSHPQFKHDLTNLRPACIFCNGKKGSTKLEQLEKDPIIADVHKLIDAA